jgi:hypothetical protein
MGLHCSPVAWHRDFEQAARYYETRLAGLLRLAEALRGRVVFLESETLLSSTRHVLDQLGTFLELQSPLQPEYRRFAHTGEIGFGDPAVSLPRTLVTRLQNAYDFWCAAIRGSCPTINPALSADQRGSSRNS